jgi:hypothetical protein
MASPTTARTHPVIILTRRGWASRAVRYLPNAVVVASTTEPIGSAGGVIVLTTLVTTLAISDEVDDDADDDEEEIDKDAAWCKSTEDGRNAVGNWRAAGKCGVILCINGNIAPPKASACRSERKRKP